VQKFETMDGNQAAAYASYAFTDVATIYPITRHRPWRKLWMNGQPWKEKHFGQPVRVVQMQSEAGAAGAMHGSLAAGH